MRLSRTTVYGLIAVLAVGAIGAGVATGAGKIKVRTKVSINFQSSGDYGDKFVGKVKAKGKHPRKIKKKCKKRRKVTVFRVVPGGKERIGSTKTNKKGRYVRNVNGLADPGKYYARAKKKTFRYKGTKVVCKKKKSKRITVS